MADGRIRVSVLEGSFTGLQWVGIPLPAVYTCKTWDCSLKVLSGWLSSPIPDSLYPSSGQSKIVLRSVRIYLVRSEESVGRGSDARLDGPVAAWGEYKAPTMWMIREKLAAQLMPTVLPLMKVLPYLLKVTLQ